MKNYQYMHCLPQDAHNDKNYIIEQSLSDDKIQKMPQQIS